MNKQQLIAALEAEKRYTLNRAYIRFDKAISLVNQLSEPAAFDEEELAKNLCVWMYNVNYIDISESQLEEARRTVTLLCRMGYLKELAPLPEQKVGQ